jgi:myo-inositol-1(or 4)-monophosphatase
MQEFLKKNIKDAGDFALRFYQKDGLSVKEKTGPIDLVTEADVAVSEFLVKKIQEKYPDHHIHSEELADDINPGAEYEWVIDPIDGTSSFSRGLPLWCIIIALLRGGETLMGCVYQPTTGDMFFAEKGSGAFRNGKQIFVSKKSAMNTAEVHIETKPASAVAEIYKRAHVNYVELSGISPRRPGSMLSACYVASGGYDMAAYSLGYDHDHLAPTLIVHEAGGRVTNYAGEEWARGMRDIVFSNGAVHEAALQLFKK